jgi:hypothetical protein
MSRENSKIFTYAFCKSGALHQRKRRREIPEDPDVLNAQALGISGRSVEISKRARGRHTM